ncbi:MAG TPA: hypothetical protein VMX33_01120 [bacterium]|nr:hypothetical protein [bacterium]
MVYCCITIDFLSQLERAGAGEVVSFVHSLEAAASAFGARTSGRKNPVVVGFRLEGAFDGLQAAESLRRIHRSVIDNQRFLRGVGMAVHEAESEEEALVFATAARYHQEESYGCTFSPEAMAALSSWFTFPTDGWIEPVYGTAMTGVEARHLSARPRLMQTAAKAVAQSTLGGPRLIHLEAGPGIRFVDDIARAVVGPEQTVLVIDGTTTRSLPFSPVIETIARLPIADEAVPLSDHDDSAFQYILASAYAGGAPVSMTKGCESYLQRRLDEFGSKGGLVVVNAPESMSIEAVSLFADRLGSGRGSERYLTIADGPIPETLAGVWAARVPLGVADSDDRAASVNAALAAAGGSVRDALSIRFAAVAGSGIAATSTDAGVSEVLGLLPREVSLYLYALVTAGYELAPVEFSEFLGGLGLRPEGEALILGLLADAGLVAPDANHALLPPLPIEPVAAAIGSELSDMITQRFLAFLIGLYTRGRIKPSMGFLRHVGERQDNERLLFDCVFADALRPDGIRTTDTGFLSASTGTLYRFWTALIAGDRPACESVAAGIEERISGPRARAVRALIRAELAYAIGDAEKASKGAREAMLDLGKHAPPKLEARSQRMMGLASLALDRHAEASDYLTNAQELAEGCGDDYERMMAAYAKAVVEFLSGGLVRSAQSADCATTSAIRLFRMDMLTAIDALGGRIDLELGLYDEAVRRFAALGERASRYGVRGAERRATIWRARALAYAGEFDEGATLLELAAEDPEARVFRGELEILRGRPREARTWLDEPVEPVARPFGPPDSIDWSSLFSEIEGRSIRFESADAPLAELRSALGLFARGLDERDPHCAVQLHDLTRADRGSRINPAIGTYSFFCYLLEERLPEPPVDKQTVLSRAFKTLQQRAGRIEDRAQRAFYMEKNAWNKRLLEAARTHKFI